MTPAINGESVFICLLLRRLCAAGAPGHRSDRGQGRTLPQLPSWQTGSRNNPLELNVNVYIPDCLDSWLDTSSNCRPLEEHQYAEVHAVYTSIQTEDFPLWSGLNSSSARTAALSEN